MPAASGAELIPGLSTQSVGGGCTLISKRQDPLRVGPADGWPGSDAPDPGSASPQAPCPQTVVAQFETSLVSTFRRGPPHREARSPLPIVTMVGEFDVAAVGALSERFSVAIALDESDLVVDLSEVPFMDAATISVLIRAKVFLGEQSVRYLSRNEVADRLALT